jgi:predicted ribosomally synthesized peptide with nif11-like leader
MSKESLEQFLSTVIDKEETSRIGDDVDTTEALIAFGAEQGFEFSEEDLKEMVELADDELASVAGGGGGSRMYTNLANFKQNLNSVGDDAQLANVDLQNMLQKQQQTLQMMSNISKMIRWRPRYGM